MDYADSLSFRPSGQSKIGSLLTAFEALLPDNGLALLDTEGILIVQAGRWPKLTLSQLAAKAHSAGWLSSNSISQQGNYRCYPLLVEAQRLGNLVIYGLPAPGVEQTLQQSLQLLMAQLLEKPAASLEPLRRNDDQQLLHRLAETISIAMNPDVIPQLVLEESQQVFQAYAGVEVGAIVLHSSVSSDHEKWELKASFGSGDSVSLLVELMHSQIDQLLDRGRPTIISNLPALPHPTDQPVYSSVLWAPLKTARQVLGGILLGRRHGQPIFTADDEKLLAALALQAALALEKAQWLAQADEKLNQQVQELKESNTRLAILQHINAVIHGSMPLNRLLRLVVENIRYSLDYPGVFICLPDEQRSGLTIRAAGGSLDRFLQRRGDTPTQLISFAYTDTQNPLVSAFIQQRVVESPVAAWRQGLQSAAVPEIIEYLDACGVAYGVAFPLWHYDQTEALTGILCVLTDKPGFSKDEQQLLSLISSQVALAIHNAQLFQAEQQGRREMEALYQAGLAITSAQTNHDVLRAIIQQIVELVGVEGCGIYRWDEDSDRLVTELFLDKRAENWTARVPHGTAYSLSKRPALRRVIMEQASISLQIDQAQTDPIELRWMIQGNFKSCLLLPLVVRERSIGVLGLTESRRQRDFSTHDIRLAQGLAAQAAVAMENARLNQDKVTRMESELELAQRIQYNLLPQQAPLVPGLDIAARTVAARHVGGDFYRYLNLPDGRFGLAIGDVSGKGVPSALFMAMTLTAIDTQTHQQTRPGALLTDLNRVLYPQMRLSRMNTGLLVAIFEPNGTAMRVANAGMIAPLVRGNGPAIWLDVAGLPVGVLADATYQGHEVRLERESLIIFASDGIVEAMNRQGVLFGFDRLQQVVETMAVADAQTVLEVIWELVSQHIGDAPPHDDMTLIVTRIHSKK